MSRFARASCPPRVRGRVPLHRLAAAAVASIAVCAAVGLATQAPIHPRFPEMLAAARTMQAASVALRAERALRGLVAPSEADPNGTGMIGAEYTPITTTLGDLPSKRTTTSPDFAAALVRELAALDLRPGTPVVLILSGSFVGANIAAVAAAEALGLRPLIVASLTASMWGANEPEFNLLDILAALRARGVIRAPVSLAVLGGEGAVGGGIDRASLATFRASAARDGVLIVEARPFAALIDALTRQAEQVLAGVGPAGAIVNVGGALIGLGTCREAFELPPGLASRPVSCTGGTPGLVMRLAGGSVPLLHILNIRRMALELGLPFDPEPLPAPGDNTAIYGSGRRNAP